MPEPYTFLSDQEHTDEQLQDLMEAVLVDVKARAAAANSKSKTLMEGQRKEAFERHRRSE